MATVVPSDPLDSCLIIATLVSSEKVERIAQGSVIVKYGEALGPCVAVFRSL
jgi:hypothetical protein